MDTRAREDAQRWLADCGVRPVGDGEWVDAEAPDRRLTANDVAHAWAGQVFWDDELTQAGQLRLAFGLLDLLDNYWVTCEIRFADQGSDGPLPADLLWDGYRQRMEGDADVRAVTYSLWVDWFEDRATAQTAFTEVLGRDVDQLRTGAPPALLRRARRVLQCSGPVPWPVKEATYRSAAHVPALHQALFEGLLGSYHDIYGDLDPAAALAILTDLPLPAETPHFAELRSMLAAGHSNHYRSTHAWNGARQTHP